ncbi:MAG: type II toxin-antitoxin system HicB family antitoxin [Desulfovibrionaceae bacterium]|nr:type II toxin-antitoxin system HicB family antitoxin [Desulfovibrionaceae bacterium]
MKNAMTHKGYVGTVEYSEKDACLFGRIAGIRDIISYEGESVAEIRTAFEGAVDDYLAHCAATGKEPNKPYSGKFVLRIDPAVHARIAAKAMTHGKSLNQYAADLLAEA